MVAVRFELPEALESLETLEALLGVATGAGVPQPIPNEPRTLQTITLGSPETAILEAESACHESVESARAVPDKNINPKRLKRADFIDFLAGSLNIL